MKRYIYLVFIGLATFVFASCEGPAGPPGADGIDMTSSTCLECHGEAQDAIQNQFATSNHYASEISYERAEEGGWSASCARCHSSEGFIAYAAGVDGAAVPVPGKWECKTCHGIHKTFEATDYAFRAGEAVDLVDGSGGTLDEGNNNTCLNCHQARRIRSSYDGTADKTYTRKFTGDDIAVYTTAAVGPGGTQGVLNGTLDTLTVVFDVPVATHVYINSSHAGPHHGPQGNLWAGLGGTVAGTPYSAHDGGCVTCHMGDASGHSFKPDLDNCVECHASKEPEMNAIADRIEDVALALEAIHAIHIDDEWEPGDDLWGFAHPMYASLTTAQFDAFWNFIYLVEDRSKSAHNPTYIKAMLSQCETALGL